MNDMCPVFFIFILSLFIQPTALGQTVGAGLHQLQVQENVPVIFAKNWILSWDEKSEALVVNKRGNANRKCKIGDGSALPAWSVYQVGASTRILAYFETVGSDLALIDAETCARTNLRSTIGTRFFIDKYVVPAWCDEAYYPKFVASKKPQLCRAAEVYSLNAKHGFDLNAEKSNQETKRQVGVIFSGEAKISDPGTPKVKATID